jgi:hypothetical protein
MNATIKATRPALSGSSTGVETSGTTGVGPSGAAHERAEVLFGKPRVVFVRWSAPIPPSQVPG